jgi:hypothetical protein
MRSSKENRHFSPRASLAAVGLHVRTLKVFETIKRSVHIRQKTIKHSPAEKLYDAFIAILSGAHGLSEINTRLRSDRVLQRAFGRRSCAEQSVVQETLNACTAENISEMEQAWKEIFKINSRAARHDYKADFLLLDIDVTGMPCGPKAERACKGYFSHERRKVGRQLARVVAAHYEETVVEHLYAGNVQLHPALRPLVEAAEATLDLDVERRNRTILRIDAGAGSLDEMNWLLERGYQLHCKDCSSERAKAFAATVREWMTDAAKPDRQLGWVECESTDFVRPVKRLALRWEKRNKQVAYGMLITTLSPAEVLKLVGESAERIADPQAVILAYAKLYDQRGGTVEIEFKEDKQGIGMTKRNKKRFEAQRMVMLLGSLAHNVVVWIRERLSRESPKLRPCGLLRFVRDVFQVSGFVEEGEAQKVRRLVLNRAAPWARACAKSLHALLKPEHISVILGQT